jgi:hypothetical protein
MGTQGVRDSYARDHLSHSLYQHALNISVLTLKKQSTKSRSSAAAERVSYSGPVRPRAARASALRRGVAVGQAEAN